MSSLNERLRRYSVLFWIAGAAVLIGAVWFVGWSRIEAAAASLDVRWFLAMTALEGMALWIRAFKWRYVLGAGRGVYGLYFLSKAAGNFTPGRVGELSPLLLKGHRKADVGAWIVADRVIESSSTLLFGVAGMLLLGLPTRSALIAVGVLASLVALAGISVAQRGPLLKRVHAQTHQGTRVHRFASAVETFLGAIGKLRRVLPAAILFTAVGTATELWGNLLLYRSFGYEVGFPVVAAAKCAHGLVGALPLTPSPTGMPHVATGLVVNSTSGVPVDVVIAALALQVVAVNIVFWTSFAFGMLDLRRANRCHGGDEQ